MIKLVPIGAWCRTAYQVNTFNMALGVDKVAYPFDWTITPFSALVKSLSNNFNVHKALKSGSVALSQHGSIVDLYSDVIFHHSLDKKIVEKHDLKSCMENGAFETQAVVSDTLGRFQYAMQNLEKLQHESDILFVRWQRLGHPDAELDNVFEGESIDALNNTLFEFLGHDSFNVLVVKTSKINSEYDGPLFSISRLKEGLSAVVYERRGFDGDGTNDFRGDTRAWQPMLNEAYNILTLGKKK